MKKTKLLFVLFIATYFLFGSSAIWAQTTTIEPNVGFVNEIIKNDVNTDGTRKNTTYILRRGGVYFINGSIANTGFVLTIKAEDGSGALPIIQNYPDASGAYNTLVTAKADCYLYNIYFDGMGTNLDTGQLDRLVAQSSQMVNCDVASIVVSIDGCIFTNCNTVFIRTAGGARKVQVLNSTFANSCQISVADPGNGRLFECRDKTTDSVIVKNCTAVNLTDRIFRHLDGSQKNTGWIQYIEFDHNTFVNQMGLYGCFMFGDLNKGAKITNNLLVNCQSMGFDSTSTILNGETIVHGELIPSLLPAQYGYRYLFCDELNATILPSFQFNNNVVMYNPEIKTLWAQYAPKTVEAPALSKRITSLLTTGSKAPTTVNYIALKRIPNWPKDLMNYVYSCIAAGSISTTNTVDFDRHSRKYWSDSLDCSYTTSNSIFKGTDGKPVGSGKWASTIVGVEEETSQVPTEFSLSQNYPNPFNPTTQIQFNVPVQSKVSLIVYNVAGQEVKRLVNQDCAAGSHSITFNAAGLSSGVYIYKMNATGTDGKTYVSSQKMTLMK